LETDKSTAVALVEFEEVIPVTVESRVDKDVLRVDTSEVIPVTVESRVDKDVLRVATAEVVVDATTSALLIRLSRLSPEYPAVIPV